ncbi:MAG: S-layer homology domain-containing protein [Oscillospiraceae bacterium]
MRHKLAAALLCVVLLVGVTVAAVGGSAVDPLISLRYLNETYLPQTILQLAQRAAAQTDPIYTAAVKKLDDLAGEQLKKAEALRPDDGMNHSATFAPVRVKRGDAMDMTLGTGLIFHAGRANVAAGTFVDVTDGTECVPGDKLTVGHRYLAVGSGMATVAILSDGAAMSLQGSYAQRLSQVVATPFTDLSDLDWFYDAARYCYVGDLFQGTSATQFTPHGSMTRAMLATVLYRLAGEPAGGEHSFSDVPADRWYTGSVAWASLVGIVQGMDKTTFLPEGLVTREHIAVMLYRYAGTYLKQDVTATATLASFPDGARVSSWATDAVCWAVDKKVMNGRDSGALDPSGTATRAEVATMLQRFSVLISVG